MFNTADSVFVTFINPSAVAEFRYPASPGMVGTAGVYYFINNLKEKNGYPM